jgi:hypothetical protein
MMQPRYLLPSVITRSLQMQKSFMKWLNVPLLDAASPEILAQMLYEAPYPILSKGPQEDPIFCYANLAAQKLWEMQWNEFTQLPSRLSAPSVDREERQRLIERAAKYGYVDDYAGIRISKSGQRFMIKDTILWKVLDDEGNFIGQAARIGSWDVLQ